jgi:hypothetical protein
MMPCSLEYVHRLSEEHTASNTLEMETARSSETPLSMYYTTQREIPKASNLHSHCKCHILLVYGEATLRNITD